MFTTQAHAANGGGGLKQTLLDDVTWDFGDGGTLAEVAGQTPTHTFHRAGFYTVTLRVRFCNAQSSGEAAAEKQALLDDIGNRSQVSAQFENQDCGAAKSSSQQVQVVAPRDGPVDVQGMQVAGLPQYLYPVPDQGTYAGDNEVFVSPRSSLGSDAPTVGVRIGNLQLLGGEIWINRRTGYIGPKPGDRHADPIYGEMIVQGQLFDLGQLQRPLQLRRGALASGPGQTFADNFDGQAPSGPVTVKGLPLFSDARGSVTLPTVTLSPPATTSATWAVSMPGPLGDSIGNGNVPGNPETRVPTLIHAGPVSGTARDRVAGRRHAAGDVPDFNLKVPSFTLGPISASFSLSHASDAADPWFGGGTITAAIPPLPTISIDANYDPQNALGFAIRSDDSIDFVGARIKTNIPLFDIAKLEALTVRFGTHPFYLAGDATFANAGPVDLVTVNGCLAYIYGQNTHRTLNLCPRSPTAASSTTRPACGSVWPGTSSRRRSTISRSVTATSSTTPAVRSSRCSRRSTPA